MPYLKKVVKNPPQNKNDRPLATKKSIEPPIGTQCFFLMTLEEERTHLCRSGNLRLAKSHYNSAIPLMTTLSAWSTGMSCTPTTSLLDVGTFLPT